MYLAWGLVMVLAAVLYWTLLFFSYQYCPPSPFPFYTSSHSCSHFFLENNKVSLQLGCVGWAETTAYCKPCLLPSGSWGCSRPTCQCQLRQLRGVGGWEGNLTGG